MKFLSLLYVPPEVRDDPDARAGLAAWFAYGDSLSDVGALLGNNALEGLQSATTVRVRDGETLITDGPFAETKEMLGGYYLVDLPSREDAIAWAARAPNAPYGSIEVRPVLEAG
jgi:hypothetical protein